MPNFSNQRLIGIVTAEKFLCKAMNWYGKQVESEDMQFGRALETKNYSVHRVAWTNPNVNWDSFCALIIRTTWDYFDFPEHFLEWVGLVGSKSLVFNTPEIIRWNAINLTSLSLKPRAFRFHP